MIWKTLCSQKQPYPCFKIDHLFLCIHTSYLSSKSVYKKWFFHKQNLLILEDQNSNEFMEGKTCKTISWTTTFLQQIANSYILVLWTDEIVPSTSGMACNKSNIIILLSCEFFLPYIFKMLQAGKSEFVAA